MTEPTYSMSYASVVGEDSVLIGIYWLDILKMTISIILQRVICSSTLANNGNHTVVEYSLLLWISMDLNIRPLC